MRTKQNTRPETLTTLLPLAYSSLPLAVAVNLIVSIVVLFIFSEVIPETTLTVWISFVIVVSGMRLLLWHQFRRSHPDAANIRKWSILLTISSGFGGLVWGAAGVIFFTPHDPYLYIFLLLVVGGMATGSLVVSNPYVPAFYAFFLTSLPLLGLRILLSNEPMHIVNAAMIAVYCIVIATLAHRLAKSLISTVTMRYRISGILNHINDGIIAIGRDGTIQFFNRAAELIFGYSAEQIHGKDISVLIPEIGRSKNSIGFTKYFDSDVRWSVDVSQREVVGVREDGSRLQIDISFNEMSFDKEPILIGTIRDITKQKKVEGQLQHVQRMEVTGQLMRGIAHDFNNLLTAVLGNLDLLQERFRDDVKAQRLINSATRAATRGSEMTRRLLAFARKESLRPESTDLNQLLMGLKVLMRESLDETVEIEFSLTDDLWLVLVDSHMLENAIMNLILNASDAMPNGGKITIETTKVKLDKDHIHRPNEVKPGEYVCLKIKDTGTGMSKEVMGHAFDPFYTTKGTGKGTGLGLSMVYGFVKQSGGYVHIDSKEGGGTTVKLLLPKAVSFGYRLAPKEEKKKPTTKSSGKETILVIEDDEEVRKSTVMSLKSLGYIVFEARDGQAALELIQAIPSIDVLFTDVVLPGELNGAEIAHQVQAQYPKVKVLYTSGYSEDIISHHGELNKDIELLHKPYTKKSLDKKIRQILATGRDQANPSSPHVFRG